MSPTRARRHHDLRAGVEQALRDREHTQLRPTTLGIYIPAGWLTEQPSLRRSKLFFDLAFAGGFVRSSPGSKARVVWR